MAEMKTKETEADVEAFLNAIPDESRRADCFAVARMMQLATAAEPRMWGPSIVGFGRYHYKYPSGREGDWFLAGFSPRKNDLTIYIVAGFDRFGDLMKKLGKHRTGKSCLYIKRLADVDESVLKQLIRDSVAHVRASNT